MQNDNFKNDEFHGKKAKIRVIGVGGGGGNAVNRMVQAAIAGVDFIALNTDAQDLRRNLAPYRVQIGENLTKGLGVGGDPEKGYKAAEESKEQVKQIVSETDFSRSSKDSQRTGRRGYFDYRRGYQTFQFRGFYKIVSGGSRYKRNEKICGYPSCYTQRKFIRHNPA
jgi:hypothetical protein